MLIVILASGPDKGQVHEFSDNETVILGRTAGPIQFTDSKISRQHVKLWCEGGQWLVCDLDSRHGSYRNNKPISGSRTQLKDGDRLQIGRTVLVLSRVPVEQARKMELLDDPDNAPMELPVSDDVPTKAAPTTRARQVQHLGVALAAAAVALVVGLNLFMLIDARRQNAALQAQLKNTSPAAAIDQDKLVANLREALTRNPEELRQAMRDVLAESRTDDVRRQELLESILAEVKLRQGESTTAVAKLDEVLTAVRDQPKLTEALVNEQLAQFTESRQEQEKMLRELFAAVQAQPDQIHAVKTELVQAIKSQPAPERPKDVEPLLREMLAKLDVRGQADEASLKQILGAIAAQPKETRELFGEVLTKLDAQPKATPDPRIDELLAAVKSQPQQTDALLKQMLANLDAQAQALAQLPTDRKQMVESIEAALAGLPTQQAAAMREVLTEVLAKGDAADDAVLKEILGAINERPTQQQLSAAIDAAIQNQPRTGEAMLKDVLSAVEAQPTKEQLAAAVEAKIREQREASDSLLQMLHEELKRRPTQEQITASLDEALAAKLSPRDELLKQILVEVTNRPDLAPQQQALQDILAAVKAQPEQTDAMLKQVMARLDALPEAVKPQRDPLLSDILAAVQAQPSQSEPLLRELAAKLDATRAAGGEADTANAQLLKQIAAAVESQPVQTKQLVEQVLAKLDASDPATSGTSGTSGGEAMLKEILAAVKEKETLDAAAGDTAVAMSGDRHEQLLRQVLAELRSRSEPIAQAVLDGVRNELREQVRVAMAQGATAAQGTSRQAPPSTAATAKRDASSPTVSIFPNIDPLAGFDTPKQAGPAKPGTGGASGGASGGTSGGESLTDTQLAYKRAWETGMPEVVGGRTDPATGQLVDGRLLDPTRARTMGIQRWQDWYMIDDLKEQERLRLAATQFAAAKPSPLTTPLYQLASGQAATSGVATSGGAHGSEQVAGSEQAPPLASPKRVIFVLDASESLSKSMPQAIARLQAMIDELADEDVFTVLVYQERGSVTEVPPRGLKPSTLKAAEHVINWLKPEAKNIDPRGYANPIEALKQAMTLKPDDIYLVSAQICGKKGEAMNPQALMAAIQKLPREPQTRIHTVELFRNDPQGTLKRVADQLGGTYRFVPEPSQSTSIPGGAEAPIQ